MTNTSEYKTHHFFIKEDKLWVISEMPEEPIRRNFEYELPFCKAIKKYGRALKEAKQNAIEVQNQDDVMNRINDPEYGPTHLVIGKIYSLECKMEVKKQVQITFDDGKEWSDCRPQHFETTAHPKRLVALISFEESKSDYIHNWQDQMTVAAGIDNHMNIKDETPKEVKPDFKVFAKEYSKLISHTSPLQIEACEMDVIAGCEKIWNEYVKPLQKDYSITKDRNIKLFEEQIVLRAKIKDLESKLSNTSTGYPIKCADRPDGCYSNDCNDGSGCKIKVVQDIEVNEMIAKVHDDIEGRYNLDSHDKTVIQQLLCKLQR